MRVPVPASGPTASQSSLPSRGRTFLNRPLPWTGYLSLATLLFYGVAVLAAPMIAANAPNAVFVADPFEPPSLTLWLGTDDLGRDVASRFLYGGRTVLSTACGAAAISTVVGGFIGILLGLRAGLVDEIGMRLLEIVMSIPAIIVALLVIGFAGSGSIIVILTVGLLSFPSVARVVRAAIQAFAAEDFIAAARARGEGLISISLHELLPNIYGTLLVEFSIRTGYAVLLIAGLGFLGFGAAPPSPDWGSMINEGRSSLDSTIWPVLAPAIGIAVLVTSVNLLTDALLQCLGPVARGGGRA